MVERKSVAGVHRLEEAQFEEEGQDERNGIRVREFLVLHAPATIVVQFLENLNRKKFNISQKKTQIIGNKLPGGKHCGA